MADEGQAEQGAPIVERVAGGDGALSALAAARSLVDSRRKDRTEGEAPPDGEQPPAQESASQEADTAQETGPGETQAEDAAQETEPPIDPPRSWTKEDKELFKGLPRETQERLADRERSREREFSTRLNEAAEKSKGLTAKEQAAEQVRQQYEQALPMLMQALQEQHQGEFSDVKTIADIERLARDDWPRYVLWDAQQKKIAAVQQQVQAAQAREAQETQTKWQSFVTEQDALFAEKAPDLADKEKASKAAEAAGRMLNDLGFTDTELGKLYFQGDKISFRDHRMQLLIRDALRFREAQSKVKTAVQRPVPQVQRPGVQEPRSLDADGRIKDLDSRLNQSGSLRDAAALLVAQRRARAGR